MIMMMIIIIIITKIIIITIIIVIIIIIVIRSTSFTAVFLSPFNLIAYRFCYLLIIMTLWNNIITVLTSFTDFKRFSTWKFVYSKAVVYDWYLYLLS